MKVWPEQHGNKRSEGFGGEVKDTRASEESTHPTEPPRTMHDGRLGALSRRMKVWLEEEARGMDELDVLEDLPNEFQWSDSSGDDILRAVALDERHQKRFARR